MTSASRHDRTSPALSIGMPVYNGGSLMRRAVDSVLKQDFTDFELVICDNGSTDNTAAVAAEYTAADPRVRYVRNESTVGVIANFERSLLLARGEMFAWIAHDDTYERPDHLTLLVAKIRAGNVFAFPEARIQYIDEHGAPLRSERNMLTAFGDIRTRGQLIRQTMRRPSVQIYGLFRTDKLREHIHIFVEDGDLRCFNEGRLMQKFLLNEKWAFVPEALLNVGQHTANNSGVQRPGALLRDFLVYCLRVLKMNNGTRFTSAERPIVYAEILRQAPYAMRLLASTIRRHASVSRGEHRR